MDSEQPQQTNQLSPFQGNEEIDEEEGDSDKETASAAASGPDFNYLLNMPLWYLTKEKKDELCKQRGDKVGERAVTEKLER